MVMLYQSKQFWLGMLASALWILGLGLAVLDTDGPFSSYSSTCTSGDLSCPSTFSSMLSTWSLEDGESSLSMLQRQAVQLTATGQVVEKSLEMDQVRGHWEDFVDFMGKTVGPAKPLTQKEEDHLHEVMDGSDAASGLPSVKYKEGLTIPIEPWKLSVVCVVVFAAAWGLQHLRIGIGDQIVVAAIRLSVQMIVLGYVLYPIFLMDNPWIVGGYILFFMLFVASWEAAARPKLMYPGMLTNATLSILFGLTASIGVLTFVVAPTPWYSARYTVPLAGMLVQFSLTGVAPALNMLTEFLASRKEHVEVLLSLGATPYEACWPCFTLTVRQALIPSLNSMNVAGLVTIPGMMAGQIIGGADPQNAALYQITILTIGSVCAVIAVCSVCLLSIRSLFDERGRLQSSLIIKQGRTNIVATCAWFLWPPNYCMAGDGKETEKAGLAKQASKSKHGKLGFPEKSVDSLVFHENKPFANPSAATFLDLNITGMIALTNPVKVCLPVHEKEVACIMGPSGIGKSTILKMVNDLQSPLPGSTLKLRGQSQDTMTPQAWRRDVMYIHQSKAPLPGTPADLLEDIKKMKVNQGRPGIDPVPIMEQLGLPGEFLQRPWSELSGGEAQRVTCSITLAMKPTIILLDEPTSGLDDAAKKQFEKVLSESSCTSILVTHDEQQAARVGSSIWKLGRE